MASQVKKSDIKDLCKSSNILMNNVYTIFQKKLDCYNEWRSKKIELAYIGTCQEFHVFAGDWRNLFLINSQGGFEIYLCNSEPKTLSDIEADYRISTYPIALKTFNFKKFIKWLYERNTLVKQVKWSNLQVINFIRKSADKIEAFHPGVLIDSKTGKKCGYMFEAGSLGPSCQYYIETNKNQDKPYCLMVCGDNIYRFYLPDLKPKSQKDMEIVPNFPFDKNLLKSEIKELKQYQMKFISQKSSEGNHLNYYELLLLYRAYNPNIPAIPIKPENDTSYKMFDTYFYSCSFIVRKYAKNNGKNPYKILSEMYDKGYIDEYAHIIMSEKDNIIRDFPYLCAPIKDNNME